MEEEKAAAYYDELTRKGRGAARSMVVFSLKSLLSSLRVVWSSAVMGLEEKALDFRPNYARFTLDSDPTTLDSEMLLTSVVSFFSMTWLISVDLFLLRSAFVFMFLFSHAMLYDHTNPV
ncbi:hypothetical protein LWI29_026846 [Acer saccharum]|uniref:Uncharacterized protein n=1 Tax=Acer saccharum TaxID=4024 RepID=A0AA39VSL8_ACESA|nr:hypothetical protein LWI29_026846 [Acer saccharum]